MSVEEPKKWRHFELFTEGSRHATVEAQREARSLEHRYFGVDHLLLGLLRVEGNVAHSALSALGVTIEYARDR